MNTRLFCFQASHQPMVHAMNGKNPASTDRIYSICRQNCLGLTLLSTLWLNSFSQLAALHFCKSWLAHSMTKWFLTIDMQSVLKRCSIWIPSFMAKMVNFVSACLCICFLLHWHLTSFVIYKLSSICGYRFYMSKNIDLFPPLLFLLILLFFKLFIDYF